MKIIKGILEYIVPRALQLNKIYLPNESVQINYAAIFCKDESEFTLLKKKTARMGKIIENTPTGPLYKFDQSIDTSAGPLWLLKIRNPDYTRPERGDADFTLEDYSKFKDKHLQDVKHFKLIKRENFEMIELRDSKFDVLCYFSNPILAVQYGIK